MRPTEPCDTAAVPEAQAPRPAEWPSLLEQLASHPREPVAAEVLLEIRRALAANAGGPAQTRALSVVFQQILGSRLLWYDALGRVAAVEAREGLLSALVELVLFLVYPEDWPGVSPESRPSEAR